MTLSERCSYFWSIFEDLQDTNSILEKRYIISKIPEWLTEDFQYIIECLNGKHKFGYTYEVSPTLRDMRKENNTVKDVLEFLQEPRKNGDLSERNIERHVNQTAQWWWFFQPIVNRTLKLGIGNSILPKDGLAPMLAKKYEGTIKRDNHGYYITVYRGMLDCIVFVDGREAGRIEPFSYEHVIETVLPDKTKVIISFPQGKNLWTLVHISFSDNTPSIDI